MKPASLLFRFALSLPFCASLQGEEGMWTFDNLPRKQLKDTYGFEPTQAWVDQVRLSALRFPEGSGSFVSAEGLVLTNHHVAHHWIQSVSSKGRDLVRDGFVARTRTEEIPVPGLSLLTLVSMEDITERVASAATQEMNEAQAAAARKGLIKALVEEEGKKTGLACESVSLYQGGQTWIYRYKKHTDVRLVMAPEYDVAAFGKDWDNFSWPRHDLDFTLFRVYENGLPLRPGNHLAWSAEGIAYGGLTFTVGHPGRTARLETLAQMAAKRDEALPARLRSLERTLKHLREQAAQGGEAARKVTSSIMGAENAYKVFQGELRGLRDGEAMAQVEANEKRLREQVEARPELKALAGNSWKRIEEALAEQNRLTPLIRISLTDRCDLMKAAARLLRAEEKERTSARKARTAKDKAALKHLDAPETETETDLDAAVQIRELTLAFREIQDELGIQHPTTLALLKDRQPAAAAEALVKSSGLLEAGPRRALLAKGGRAIQAFKDPALEALRQLEELKRASTKRNGELQAVISEHLARIAQARFQIYGTSTYPDATFTLRLSYGAVATYPSNGSLAQPFTTFAGLFDRAAAWGPTAESASWALPPRWKESHRKLDLLTPYNFITTNDIIGGNSGSPVVDRKGELVGLAFDGNIESLPGRYYFDGRANRTICVDSRGILESLQNVFDAPHLVRELRGR